MKIRRVGSVTCGFLLVIIGILCLIHIFYPAFQYEYILRGWPIVLISIGGEILAANMVCSETTEIKYDVPAVIMVFILVAFAIMMALLEYGITML